MYLIRPIALLALAYLALTANLEPLNVVAALVVGGLVVLLIRPQPRRVNWRRAPQSAWALGRYVLVLVYDLVVSGLQVARIVLSPVLPIRPGIIAIDSRSATEMGTALNAHAITLTPGEMVVEIDADGIMYTYCLDAAEAEPVVEQAQKLRIDLLDKIF